MNFKDDKKPKTNIAMKLGTLIDVEGIKLMLVYVNEGKQRLTFIPADSAIRVEAAATKDQHCNETRDTDRRRGYQVQG
jgi:hypothetical protein